MKGFLLLGVAFTGLGFRALPAQDRGPDVALRYRLIQVVEDSTLLEKINDVAGSGYRLVSVAPALGGTSVAVLEKGADPRDTYAYLLFIGKGDAALQEQLNDAGAKGFRLVSRDTVGDWWDRSHPKSAIAWMERAPGPLTKFEYAVIGFGAKMGMKATLNPKLWADANPLDYVKPEIQRAADRGYRLVWILSGGALIMEKAQAAGNDPSTQAAQSPATQTPPPFRTLKNLKGSKLRRELQKAAAASYCIIDIDPEPIPMWPVILLENNELPPAAGKPDRCSYEVLDKQDVGEKDLDEAGARGFRLVPQSLSSTLSNQNQHLQFGAILEKGRGPSKAYHYRLVSAPQLSALSEKVTQASEEGFRAVRVESAKDGIVMIMEKSEAADIK